VSLPVELASLLAHELEPSLLSLESQLRALLGDEGRREPIESCLLEVASLRSIIRDVLLLKSRALDRAPFALEGPLEALLERFTPVARARGIGLEVEALPGTRSVLVLGNARATERVLSNLLDNAIKFSPAGSGVALQVGVLEDRVEVAVVDRGFGIDSEEQSRIFDPFVRLDRDRPGTGLGLTLARALTDAQQGRLTLTSSLGAGSRFAFSLPRVRS
jgi:signal transduction histidine kinase